MVLVLLLTAEIASSIALRSIIARLNSDHHVLWLKMDCPTKWYLTLSRGSDVFENIGTNRISLAAWLSNKEYIDLNDPVITKFALRRKFVNRPSLAVVMLLISYGLLRYFGVLSTTGAAV